MINFVRQQAENHDWSDRNGHILNFEERGNSMLNTSAVARQKTANQTNESYDEEDSLQNIATSAFFAEHNDLHKDTVDALKKTIFDDAALLAPRTEAILDAHPRRALRLMKHHTDYMLAQLSQLRGVTIQPDDGDLIYEEKQQMVELMTDLPKYIRSRLDPVFSRPGLFDSDGRFQLRFARWEREYTSRLARADYWFDEEPTTTSRYQDRTYIFEHLYFTLSQIIRDMGDELNRQYGPDPE